MMLKILENFKEKFNIIFIPYIIYFYGITIVFSLLYMVLFSILFDSFYDDFVFISLIGIGVFLYFKFRNRIRIFDLYMLFRNDSKFSAKWIVLALIIFTTIIPTVHNIIYFKKYFYESSNIDDLLIFAKMMIFFPLIVLYVLVWLKIDKEDYQKYINGERITITSRFQKFWNGEYDDLKEENQ